MFELNQLSEQDGVITKPKETSGLHIDDLTNNTTFVKWFNKIKIDLENPDDPNFNKETFRKEYEKSYLKRPMTLDELDILSQAHSEKEYYRLQKSYEEEKELQKRVEENAPIMGIYTDFVYDPLNALPVGNLASKAKFVTKLATGAGIGAGYGATYNYMNNEIDNTTGGYVSSMLWGAALGGSLETANIGLQKLFRAVGNPEKITEKSINIFEKNGNSSIKWTTSLDNTFDIMSSSPNKLFNEYGLMFAPNLLTAEGNLINAKSAKELLFAKAVSAQESFRKAVLLGKKEIEGWNIPVKEAEIHKIISDAYFNRFVKENLEIQLKSVKTPTEKEALQEQIKELQKKIDELDNKYSFLRESGVIDDVSNTFKFYQKEYEKVGKKLPKRDYYMTTRWDFEKIDNMAKAGKLQELYDTFYKMVYYGSAYDEFLKQTAGKGEVVFEDGTVKQLSKEEFAKKTAKEIVDRLLASHQKREFMTSVNVNLHEPNTKNMSGSEIRVKFRNLNHYYGQDFLNKDLYSNLHHYATKASGVLGIRKALKSLKDTKPELYKKLEETIERHPEKKWKIDVDLHNIIEQMLLDEGQSVPRKYTKAMADSIRQILGTNFRLNNKDDWMYRTIKLADTLATTIFGGGFGLHSAADPINAVFVGNLIEGGHLKEAIDFLKDIKEVRKAIKDPEKTGKLLKELAVFTETMGGIKLDNITIDPSVTLSPNKGKKIDSMYDKIISTLNWFNDKQFRITGMRWITGTAQATAAFKYIKDFEAIAKGAKPNPKVLKIMGISHEDAIEIGKALLKAKSKVQGTEIPDLGKFAEIAKQKLEKDILNDMLKETKESFIKRSYNARVRAYIRKNDNHYPTTEIKEQLKKEAIEAFNKKKDKIIERIKKSKKYQKRLEEALTDDHRSLLAKFNYGVTNAMDLKFIGGATPRLPSLAATVDNNADYIIQALFLKFLKYPLAAYTSMMRYGISHDKIGLAVGTIASIMGMMSLEALRDQASSMITGKEPKYDLNSPEGVFKLALRGANYATAIGGATIPLEIVTNMFREDPSDTLTGMAVPNMISETGRGLITAIKNGEFTNSNLKQISNLAPFAHWPMVGDVLYKSLKEKSKKELDHESIY